MVPGIQLSLCRNLEGRKISGNEKGKKLLTQPRVSLN
jgi:hypothetical protein